VPEHDVRSNADEAWPELPYAAWKDTLETLHLWSQIVGKTLIPYGRSVFQIDMDFVDHRVTITRDSGASRVIGMYPRSVADFYAEFNARMGELDLRVPIHSFPNEIASATAFAEDHVHASYDPEYATRCWRVLLACHRVFTEFRAGYRGKFLESTYEAVAELGGWNRSDLEWRVDERPSRRSSYRSLSP
jgi:hypothetical protein